MRIRIVDGANAELLFVPFSESNQQAAGRKSGLFDQQAG